MTDVLQTQAPLMGAAAAWNDLKTFSAPSTQIFLLTQPMVSAPSAAMALGAGFGLSRVIGGWGWLAALPAMFVAQPLVATIYGAVHRFTNNKGTQ